MSEVFTQDNLLSGTEFPALTKAAVLKSGQNLSRGAVLGVVTASGKLLLNSKAAIDGSADAIYILAEDCDATSADAPCVVYETGIFNPAALSFTSGTVVADATASLRSRSIFLRTIRSF